MILTENQATVQEKLKKEEIKKEKWYQESPIKKMAKLLIFCLLLILVLFPSHREAPTSPKINSDGVADALEKESEAKTTKSKRTIKFNSPQQIDLSLNDNTGVANWYNPETNQVNFVFNLYVGDKLYYQSGQVPPGNYIQSITLKESLAAGDYEGTLVINTFSITSGQAKNGMTFKIKLKVG